MRILQVNSYMPIRQNRITFRGEEQTPIEVSPEKPLLVQLDELEERFTQSGAPEEKEREYRKLYALAEEKLIKGTATADDAKVLTSSAEIIIRTILSGITRSTRQELRQAMLDKADIIHKAVEGIIPVAFENSNGQIRIRNGLHFLFAPYRKF